MISPLDRQANSAFTLSYKIQTRWQLTSFKNEFAKFESFELKVVSDWNQRKNRHGLEKAASLKELYSVIEIVGLLLACVEQPLVELEHVALLVSIARVLLFA